MAAELFQAERFTVNGLEYACKCLYRDIGDKWNLCASNLLVPPGPPINAREKSFCKTSFHLRIDGEHYCFWHHFLFYSYHVWFQLNLRETNSVVVGCKVTFTRVDFWDTTKDEIGLGGSPSPNKVSAKISLHIELYLNRNLVTQFQLSTFVGTSFLVLIIYTAVDCLCHCIGSGPLVFYKGSQEKYV